MKKFLAAMLILGMLTLTACQGNGGKTDIEVPDAKPQTEELLTEEEKPVENFKEQSEEKSTEKKPTSEEKTQGKEDASEKPVETKPTEPKTISVKAEPLPFWKDGLSEEKLIFPSDGCTDQYSYFYLYNDTKKLAYKAEQIFSDNNEKANANLLLNHAENAASLVINFNNNLQFKVFINETNLLIYASDTDSALLYDLRLTNAVSVYDHYAKGQLNPRTGKPVIYLYPEKETDCRVTVDYPRFSYTYPTYENGWSVTAFPDGRLINKKDNSEHYYLFWEGNERIDWTYEEGFVVKGEDSEKFLREKLAFMGLTPREYNDFITYWVPQMKDNPYNLITFAGEQYERLAPLTVVPQPDSVLRVHMVYKPIKEKIKIKEQVLKPFERKGFTVVEWGGTRDD